MLHILEKLRFLETDVEISIDLCLNMTSGSSGSIKF
jgi:hypothetical protein